MDCNPPDPLVHGILQARIRSGFPFASPGNLPRSGIEVVSPALAGRFLTTERGSRLSLRTLLNIAPAALQMEERVMEPEIELLLEAGKGKRIDSLLKPPERNAALRTG